VQVFVLALPLVFYTLQLLLTRSGVQTQGHCSYDPPVVTGFAPIDLIVFQFASQTPPSSIQLVLGQCVVQSGGKRGRPVEFSNVLHVPDLVQSPVCAVFDSHKLFSVVILETVMIFIRSRAILFTARVHASIVHISKAAHPFPLLSSIQHSSSTLPMDAFAVA